MLSVLTDGKRVSVINAPAGSGKTHVLAEAGRAWEAAGLGPVIGITASQSARNTLAAGIPVSYNTAQFLGHLPGQRGARGPVAISPGTLLSVDETSMISGPDLADLISLAEAKDGKVILAGDTAQLQAVENGGGMSLLADRLGYVQLAEPVRFRAGWEQAASLRLRAGDASVLAEYDQHGRISGGEPEQMMDAAAAAYVALTVDGTDTLLMAADHALRRELSRRIRDDLIRLGIVRPGPGRAHRRRRHGQPRGPDRLHPQRPCASRPGNPAGPWPTATCCASTPSPTTGCSSAGHWTPTRKPGSAAGPTGTSCTRATKLPNWAMRSPTTPPRAAPCTPAWR